MEAITLHDTAIQEIFEIGQSRSPAEACGVLLPAPWRDSWVREVPNRSLHCQDSFEYTTYDLKTVLAEWFEEATSDDLRQLVLWHTHPKGGVGPSRIDMRNKLRDTLHLVVAITDEGPVPTLY